MGLFKNSVIILIVAIAIPLAFRAFAPESTKAQFNAYVSQYKTIDSMLKRASGYLDLSVKHANIGCVKSLLANARRKIETILDSSSTSTQRMVTCAGEPSTIALLTKDELAKFDGSPGSKGLYLAFMGSVYDVSKKKEHYEPGGDYAFFSAKDATRAFLTGIFQPDEMTDNLDGVPVEQFDEVDHWSKFYANEYPLVARVIGNFYDRQGCPTEIHKIVLKAVKEAKSAEVKRKVEDYTFPECNTEWNTDTQRSRVWCSVKSGGIERDWVGVPRKLYAPESKSFRCVCVRNSGPPSTGGDVGADVGDLNHPRLEQYKDCDPASHQCDVSL